MAIQSFGCRDTKKLFEKGEAPKQGVGWASVVDKAKRKVDLIDAADQPFDLATPPGNRLEKLEGYENVWSIRINKQWRIAFEWTDEGPEKVQIVDYHD